MSLTYKLKLSPKSTVGSFIAGEKSTNHIYVQMDELLREIYASGEIVPERVNPRSHQSKKCLRGNISKQMEVTLVNNPEDFCKLNRGLTSSVKEFRYDRQSHSVSLVFGEKSEYEGGRKSPLYGFLDGMTSLTKVKQLSDKARAAAELGEEAEPKIDFTVPAMHIEVLCGETDHEKIGQISVGRNTTKTVTPISIENHKGSFDWLKALLKNEPYYSKLGFEENADSETNINAITAILNLFNPYWNATGKAPGISYRGKKKLVKLHQKPETDEDAEMQKWFKKLSPIIPDILRLYDIIIESFYETSELFQGKKGRKIEAYKCFTNWTKRPRKLVFTDLKQLCDVPKSVWCPLISALRVLVIVDKNEQVKWKQDPFQFWQKNKNVLVQHILTLLRTHDGQVGEFGKVDAPYSAMTLKAQTLV